MKHDYITQISHKIDAHRQTIAALQREIDKLEGAAEVIAQLRGNDGVMALDVTPEKKSVPAFTIRKKIEDPTRRAPYKIDKVAAKETREKIIEALGKAPQATAGIVAHFGDIDNTRKQRIYASLTKMKDNGLIRRDPTGVYSLILQDAAE